MNLYKWCVCIFYLFFFFSNKKASKTRKDMQGIHEGTGAMLLPTLLVAVPSSVSVLVYCLCPSPSSAACTLCTVVYSLLPVLPAFLNNCLAIRHKVLSKSKRSYWGGFLSQMCICVSVFFSLSCLWVDKDGVFYFYYFQKCMFTLDCTSGCVTPQLKQSVLFLHSSHYSFAEGFAPLFKFVIFFYQHFPSV